MIINGVEFEGLSHFNIIIGEPVGLLSWVLSDDLIVEALPDDADWFDLSEYEGRPSKFDSLVRAVEDAKRDGCTLIGHTNDLALVEALVRADVGVGFYKVGNGVSVRTSSSVSWFEYGFARDAMGYPYYG